MTLSTTRPCLPPLSIATLIGIVLFCAYIGSAMFSSVEYVFFNSSSNESAQYSRNEELEYCKDNLVEFDNEKERVLYVQPSGSMVERLAALSASQRAASKLGATTVMVWNGRDGDGDVTEDWNDVISSPDMTNGCFPGSARSHHRSQCDVTRISSVEEWKAWLEAAEGDDVNWPLCVESSLSLRDVRVDDSVADLQFFEHLKPSKSISSYIDKFKSKVDWDDWGHWIGIDLVRVGRGSKEGAVQAALAEFKNIYIGQNDKENVRILLLVDDGEMEDILFDALLVAHPELSAPGKVVSGAAFTRQRDHNPSKNEIARLMIQGDCKVMVTNGRYDECDMAKYLGLDYCFPI